ncbi:MAG: DUF2007 domain-containing protein [Desulfuromonadaceae bacterium]|nr:DUF2007 domain-containing protein [Desulfuromonadaceae bacterium]
MIKIYTPDDDIQLAMIKGIFASEGIHFYVHNDNFGSMRPGIRIEQFNKKTFMVHEKDLERANEIIGIFIDNINESESGQEPESPKYSFFDKCRMVMEVVLFGWIMPGKRWQRKKNKDKVAWEHFGGHNTYLENNRHQVDKTEARSAENAGEIGVMSPEVPTLCKVSCSAKRISAIGCHV